MSFIECSLWTNARNCDSYLRVYSIVGKIKTQISSETGENYTWNSPEKLSDLPLAPLSQHWLIITEKRPCGFQDFSPQLSISPRCFSTEGEQNAVCPPGGGFSTWLQTVFLFYKKKKKNPKEVGSKQAKQDEFRATDRQLVCTAHWAADSGEGVTAPRRETGKVHCGPPRHDHWKEARTLKPEWT